MSLATDILAGINPQLVITAPDGQKLYVPIAPDPADGSAPSDSLWPNGFKVSLAINGVPQNDPNVYTSPTTYFVHQAPTLLTAPGPAQISWGAWVFFIATVALVPLISAYAFGKRRT